MTYKVPKSERTELIDRPGQYSVMEMVIGSLKAGKVKGHPGQLSL